MHYCWQTDFFLPNVNKASLCVAYSTSAVIHAKCNVPLAHGHIFFFCLTVTSVTLCWWLTLLASFSHENTLLGIMQESPYNSARVRSRQWVGAQKSLPLNSPFTAVRCMPQKPQYQPVIMRYLFYTGTNKGAWYTIKLSKKKKKKCTS